MTERALHPVLELTRARLLETLREPELIFWVFAFPVLMTLALGVAFRQQGQPAVRVGVVEGPERAATVSTLQQADGVTVSSLAMADADRALRDGAVQLVVVPSDPPVYRFDPTRPESRVAQLTVDRVLQRQAGREDVWQAGEAHVIAPGSRYVDWLVPGLLGMNIMSTGLWGIGFSVVYARTQKLLKRLMATPMRRWHYLAAHLLNRLVFLGLEVAMLVGFARVAFGVPVNGSLGALAVVSLVGAAAFAGIGMLVASRAKTIEAVSGLLNVVMLPMWLLSGVFFSASNFPPVMQPVISVLPLTVLNDALRDVMLEGAGVAGVAPALGLLTAYGAAAFGLALRLFRWR